MRRSRLSRKYENKSKQNLILSILGIAVILFILFRYGIPFLSDTSFFVGQITNKESSDTKKTQTSTFVSSPHLDTLPLTTNAKTVKISGTALAGLKVEIYLNGSKFKETTVDKNGNFETSIDLSEGENIVKARSISGDSKSDFSDSQTISFKKSNPNLTIDSPHDGDNLSGGNQTTVSGKTDPQNSVTVNDFLAIIDSNGNWSYGLTLVNGSNEIRVVAIDQAGNKTEKSIHVNYSQ